MVEPENPQHTANGREFAALFRLWDHADSRGRRMAEEVLDELIDRCEAERYTLHCEDPVP